MSCTLQSQAMRQVLQKMLELLDGVQESFWSARIRAALGEAVVDPQEVLSWYGGMGSFNDLMIARINGHQVPPGREQSINHELEHLRRRVFELAVQLTT